MTAAEVGNLFPWLATGSGNKGADTHIIMSAEVRISFPGSSQVVGTKVQSLI
jgi:hypothetical protein